MGDTEAAQQKMEAALARWEHLPSDRAKASGFSAVNPVPLEKPNPWHSTGTKTNGQERWPRSWSTRDDHEDRASTSSTPVKIECLVDIGGNAAR
jgi:hypothetical protein